MLSCPRLEENRWRGKGKVTTKYNPTKWSYHPSVKQSFFTQTPFNHKKFRVHLLAQKMYGYAICGGEYESSCLYYDYYFFLIIGCLWQRRTAKLRNGLVLCWEIRFGTYFVTGKGKEAEILMDKRGKLKGGRNVLLVASKKLQLDGVFLKPFLSNALRLSRAPR